MTDLAATIKSLVPMQQAARFYGFEPNQSGFIKCPFHKDKTASMKIYPGERGFCCFGCHEAGSVIDFVMKLYKLSFRDACVRLNEDLRLGLTDDKPDPEALAQRRRERQEAERKRAEYDRIYRSKTDEYRRLHWIFVNKAPASVTAIWSEEWMDAAVRLHELDEWFREQDIKDWMERHGEATLR